MPWSERQRSMLERMGLRVWARGAVAAPSQAMPPERQPAPLKVRPAPTSAPTPVPIRPAVSAVVPAPAPVVAVAASASAAGAVSTLDWPALQQVVAGCRACGLCESRTRTVFGVGHPQAHWLVVGEAPGAEEDRQGEPFVGAAGQLLDRMLAALDLSRADDGARPAARSGYIANTRKCRPPGNRNPTPDELARCEPYLARQIDLLQPRIVLAMGRFAVQSLLRSDEAIGKLRGRVHAYQGVPLVVTYHPAYLLRNPADKAKAWDDLCLAADLAERGPR